MEQGHNVVPQLIEGRRRREKEKGVEWRDVPLKVNEERLQGNLCSTFQNNFAICGLICSPLSVTTKLNALFSNRLVFAGYS